MKSVKKLTLAKSVMTMDFRCKNCNALLGKFAWGKGEIKCKCGTLNRLDLASQNELLTSTPLMAQNYPQRAKSFRAG